MSSVVDICNRALQKLGADRITSLTENSVNARECNAAYEILRDAELRAHPWNFAVKRASLAADPTTPDVYSYQYQLPSDFLRLLSHEEQTNSTDYKIEGRYILTNEGAPYKIRYIGIVTDPNQFDALFSEALSARIAAELCEKITQSNTKIQQAKIDYRDALREARKINAFEQVSQEPPEDTWISARL